MNNIIWITTFLLGLFITLGIIILNNFFYKEHFEVTTAQQSIENRKAEMLVRKEEIENQMQTLKENLTGENNDILNPLFNSLHNEEGGEGTSENAENKDSQSQPIKNTISNYEEYWKKYDLDYCTNSFIKPVETQKNSNFSQFPFRNNIIMFISTYYKDKIEKEKSKWFDEFNVNEDEDELQKDNNNNKWFYTSNHINYSYYDNLKSAAKLINVELKGPISINFTKDPEYKVTPFSILFMTKINKIEKCKNKKNCNTLFKLPLASSETDCDDYKAISIVIEEDKNNCDLKLITNFGKIKGEKGTWQNINKNLILNKNILIGLTFDGNDVIIIIDNLIQRYNYLKREELMKECDILKMGSGNILINKDGNIDMELYSFSYYNKALNSYELDAYVKYNNYYINNIDSYIKTNNSKTASIQDELKFCEIENREKVKDLLQTNEELREEAEQLKTAYSNLLRESTIKTIYQQNEPKATQAAAIAEAKDIKNLLEMRPIHYGQSAEDRGNGVNIDGLKKNIKNILNNK